MRMSEKESREIMFQEVGRHLKLVRIESNITQKKLSDKLGFTSAQYVSNIERGLVGPSTDYINAMAKMCDLNKIVFCSYMGTKFKEFYQRIFT